MENPRPAEGGRRDRGARAPRRRRGRHPHRVPGPDRRRAGRACARVLRAAGGDYKVYKNTLVKLAISGGRHEALAPLLEGPDRHRLRVGRGERRGQGPAGLRPDLPEPRDQGRAARRGLPVRPGPRRPGRPAAARRPAGPAGRGHRRPAAPARRPPAGASPQPRLRVVRPARPAGGRTGRGRRAPAEAGAAPAEAEGHRREPRPSRGPRRSRGPDAEAEAEAASRRSRRPPKPPRPKPEAAEAAPEAARRGR